LEGVKKATIEYQKEAGKIEKNTVIVCEQGFEITDGRGPGIKDILFLHTGKLLLVNEPMSLSVTKLLVQAAACRFGAVACYDNKLDCYVVNISHGYGFYPIGTRLNEQGGRLSN
jgi:hypothetical protein